MTESDEVCDYRAKLQDAKRYQEIRPIEILQMRFAYFPLRFKLDGKEIKIAHLIRQWTYRTALVFHCETDAGEMYLRHNLNTHEWTRIPQAE